MIMLHYLCVFSCLISFVNLIAILFLSNALFRILSGPTRRPAPSAQEESGLVELRDVPTYDPRFRR